LFLNISLLKIIRSQIYLLHNFNEVQHLLIAFLVLLLSNVVSGLPEVYHEWLLAPAEGSIVVEHANTVLRLGDVLEAYVALLKITKALARGPVLLDGVHQLYRDHLPGAAHCRFEFLLRHFLWNKLYKNVSLEVFLDLLRNGSVVLVELVLDLRDVFLHK